MNTRNKTLIALVIAVVLIASRTDGTNGPEAFFSPQLTPPTKLFDYSYPVQMIGGVGAALGAITMIPIGVLAGVATAPFVNGDKSAECVFGPICGGAICGAILFGSVPYGIQVAVWDGPRWCLGATDQPAPTNTPVNSTQSLPATAPKHRRHLDFSGEECYIMML